MPTHEEFSEILKLGMALAKEKFADTEMAICKGKRLAIENVLDWLKVCISTARSDLERGVDCKSVLDTTMRAMESMRDVYEEKLSKGVRLISSESQD
jgi:enamine deaminase RidA (YjgF/YER057c/UK114 family)